MNIDLYLTLEHTHPSATADATTIIEKHYVMLANAVEVPIDHVDASLREDVWSLAYNLALELRPVFRDIFNVQPTDRFIVLGYELPTDFFYDNPG